MNNFELITLVTSRDRRENSGLYKSSSTFFFCFTLRIWKRIRDYVDFGCKSEYVVRWTLECHLRTNNVIYINSIK